MTTIITVITGFTINMIKQCKFAYFQSKLLVEYMRTLPNLLTYSEAMQL